MNHYALKSFCFLNRNYLVTVPAQLNFPSTQRVCLDLSPGCLDVKFTITLETKDKTQKLLETSGLKKRHLQCISFLVSTDLTPTLLSSFLSFLPRHLGNLNCKYDFCYFTFATVFKPVSPKPKLNSWP